MKKDRLYWWCDQAWLHVLYTIGVVMSCVLIWYWKVFSVPGRLMCILAILVPIHVFEENTFPGGFFYMNNIGQRSKDPLKYPQNMLSNMVTNLGAEIIFIVMTIFADKISVTTVIVVMLFGYAECVHHTIAGIQMLGRYREVGKKTIYGPGSMSCYVGLVQISTYALAWLRTQRLETGAIIGGIGVLLFIVVGLILIPFQISRRVQSKRFAFRDNGYFKKYE